MSVYVYFIQETRTKLKRVKIGYSWNPKLRRQQIQNDIKRNCKIISVFKLEDDYEARGVERYLHAFFSEYRIKGEWFHPSTEVLNFASRGFENIKVMENEIF